MAAALPAQFVFPAGATAPAAARVTGALATAALSPLLLSYAAALDTYVDDRPTTPPHGFELPHASRMRALPPFRWLPTFRYPRWSGDVLVVGECWRAAEYELMARVVDAVLRSGRSVLYLSVYGREHAALHQAPRERGWTNRFTLARIATGGYRRQFHLYPDAPRQLRRDWAQLQALVAAHDAFVHRDGEAALKSVAVAHVLWRRLAPRLRFHTALTRTKHQPLSAVLLADSLTNQRLTVSLQHSIITCPGSFAPLLAKRYLCFGDPSRAVLASLASPATPGSPASADLIAAGSFTDPLPLAQARREAGTVVIVDQTSTWATRYFGVGGDAQDALLVVAAALAQSAAVRHVVVRLHPIGDSHAVWDPLVARWRGRIEVRSGDRALADDLHGAAAVIGLYSTVLPTAAAAGFPTFFLWQPGWFSTPDLASFEATQFVAAQSVVERVERLLGDATTFASESATARRAGAAYFHGGGSCSFDAPLVEAMLAPLPAASAALSADA